MKSVVLRLVGRETAGEARQALAHGRAAVIAFLRRRSYAPIPVADIVSGLSSSGVRTGDTLLLHSAIGALSRAGTTKASSFDPTRYASDILDAILELLGPDGTLAVPTAPVIAGIDLAVRGDVFDPENDATGTGLIPNLLLSRPSRSRSSMPWQNISALGGGAADLTAGHLLACPYAMGPGSPWSKLVERNAKVALLGVDHDRSSTVHLLENAEPRIYPRPVFFDKPHRFRIKQNGSVIEAEAFLHAVRWVDEDINRFCRYVDGRHNIYRRVSLGKATLQVFDVKAQMDAFRAEMEGDVSMYDAAFK